MTSGPLFSPLEAEILTLIEDCEADLAEREHMTKMRRLVSMLDRPALGYYRRLRHREAA